MSANNICLYLTGKKPQPYDPSNNSITINAAGNNIQANRSNSCFITPMRNTSFSDALYYDPSSGEITFDASGGVISGDASGVEYWAFDGNNNFYGPSGNTLTGTASSTSSGQIAMGDEALSDASGGDGNVGIGYRAGKNTDNDVGGGGAVVIGARAGSTDGVGAIDTIVGADAYRYAGLNSGVVGTGNTAGGYAAMRGTGNPISPGDYHTAIGYEAMFRVGDGDATAVDEKSVAVGAQALLRGGVRNVGLGYRALYYSDATLRPYHNVAVGANCMGVHTDSTDISFNNNVAVGYESLWQSGGWDGAARSNIAIGYRASYDITPTDISHTIVINATGEALNPQDSSRCYIKPISAGSGDDILYYDPSWGEITYGTDSSKDVNWWEFDAQNNFYGPDTDKSFTVGAFRNVACGVGALAQNTDGDENIAIGYNASNLHTTDTTGVNVAVGYEALAAAVAPFRGTAIGSKAMAKAPNTIDGVAIGYRALEDPISNSSHYTTAIGYEADVSGGSASGKDIACVYIGSKCRRRANNYKPGKNVVIGYRATDRTPPSGIGMEKSTHVGYEANTTSNPGGISLGYKSAGRQNGVSIGFEAGGPGGGSRSIILNAQDISLNTSTGNSLFVKPIRDASSANALYYDTSTYEITHGADHSVPGEEWWKYDPNPKYNFYGPSGNVMGTGTLSSNSNVVCGYDISGNAGATGGVAVGREAGLFEKAVAIGYRALSATNATVTPGANEGKGTVALGSRAGETTATSELSNYNTFVGYEAGYDPSGMYGEYNVALGYKANGGFTATFNASNSIVINATGENLVPQDSSRCFIKPIRNDVSYNSIQSLHYDPTSGEVTYDLNYIPSAVAAMGRVGALVVDGWPWEGYWLWWGAQLETNKAQLMYYYYRGTPYPSVYTGPAPPPLSEIIGGFQIWFDIAVSGVISGVPTGGAAEEAGFLMSGSGSVILGISLTPAGFGQLSHMVLCEVEYTNAGPPPPITVVTISNRNGVALGPWNMNTPPTYGAFLDSSGSKGMMWVNQVQDASGWDEVAPMDISRSGLGCAALGGKLYAVGGWDGGVRLDTVEVYDPIENSWNYVAPMDISRQWLGCAALGGKLYAVGGYDNPGGVFSSVEVYDPIENSWNDVAPMDVSRSELGCAALGGKLYAVGGFTGGAVLGSVEVYDPIENSWNYVAPLNIPRRGLGCAALGGKLYAVGAGAAYKDTVEVYDPIDNSWTILDATMNTQRGYFGCAALGGKLYAVGGSDGSFYLDTIEVYDPQDPSGGWNYVDPIGDLRAFVGCAASGGKLYAVGGQRAALDELLTAEVYDPSLNPQLQVTYQGEDFYVSHQRGGPKTFIIQHPEDPERLLRHACIEAPTRGTNLYEYQIQTATDNATTEIALPSYFSKLNGRARVYVFAADTLSMCYGKVNEELTQAIIHTQKAGTYNVIVTGIRKDPAALEFSSTEMIDF